MVKSSAGGSGQGTWAGGLVRQVQGEGPVDAYVVLVGEAPGEAEVSHGRSFIGASGHMLDECLRTVGMERGRCRVENVIQRRPDGNKIDTLSSDELAAWGVDLRTRLEALPKAGLIVPLGGTALNAVMGWPIGGATIMKYRGTVLRQGPWTVLPTIHPAAVLRQPSLMRRVMVDWVRVAALAGHANIVPPERELLVAGVDCTWEDAGRILQDAARAMHPISIDIETIPATKVITCVGFATSATHAITISTYYPDYASGLVDGTLDQAWLLVRRLCESPCPKIGQNFVNYDVPWLREVGKCNVEGRIFDTRWMHHSLYPSDGGDDYVGRSGLVGEDHGLAYLASIYTAEPYWKDEAKSGDRRTQLRYNGKDCAVTFEVWERLCEELVAKGRWDYYETTYEALYKVLGDREHLGGGILLDMAARKAKLASLATATAGIVDSIDAASGAQPGRVEELQALLAGEMHNKRTDEAKAARTELKGLKGRSIFGPGGGVSYLKVQQFLEGTCGVHLPKKRGAPGKATDEVTLRQVQLKVAKDSPAAQAIPLILMYRNLTKQGQFLVEKNYDADHRIRCTYTLIPETGRISSQGNAFGTGTNLQNIMREVRGVFVADEGCVLLEVDGSAAEDRVVNMLTRDPALIKLARTPPWERNPHKASAAGMFYKSEADVTKDEYELAKRTAHGTHYDMRPTRMSEVWLKESEGRLVRTPAETAYLQKLYIDRVKPQLPQWHRMVREEVLQYRCLSNPFGRILDLTYERLDDETFKRGYAYKPQSTVGMWMNLFGILPMWEWLRGEGSYTGARMALQLHDAGYFCVRPEYVWDVAQKFQQLLERPVYYYGEPMVIPVCFKIGHRWGSGVEFKRLPKRDDMVQNAEVQLSL